MVKPTLVTFTGPRDPFTPGPVAGQEVLGPVLQLLRARPFGQVILLDRPGSAETTAKTLAALQAEFPDLVAEVVGTTLKSGPRLAETAKELRSLLRSVRQRLSGPAVVSLASAPPQIYTAALLVLAGGEFDFEVVDLDPKLHPALERTGLDRLVGVAEATDRLTQGSVDADTAARQSGLVSDHPIMRRLLRATEVAAAHDAPVLISGETGTGRTTFAGLVHQLSKRQGEVCLTFDCGSLSEDAAEVTLFGSKKGRAVTPGLLERASAGTLVLEEIGELPRRLQRRLEQFIATGRFAPVGATKEVESSARLVATSARDLRQETQRGTFRTDLHRILTVVELVLPPLRERSSDLSKLIASLLNEINTGLREPRQLSRDAMVFLTRQEWPGNLRELRAVVERGALVARQSVIETDDLLTDPSPNSSLRVAEGELPALYQGFSMEDFLSKIRRGIIFKAIDQSGGNQSEASRLLGVSPQAVNKFLKVEQAAAIKR